MWLQVGQRQLAPLHPFPEVSPRQLLGAAVSPGRRLAAFRLRQLLQRRRGQAPPPRPLGVSEGRRQQGADPLTPRMMEMKRSLPEI